MSDDDREQAVRPSAAGSLLPGRGLIALLLIVVLCGLALAPLALLMRRFATAPAAVTPLSPAGAVNRIAYITPAGQLATVSAGGGEARHLTPEGAIYQFPAWSPDGRQIAVIGETGLFILADESAGHAGAELTALYEDPLQRPFYLYWSPDSTEVSFLANHPDGIGLHLAGMTREGAVSNLLATGEPFYWDWLPEGEQVLIHTGFSGEDSRLAFLNPADGTLGDNVAAPGFFQAPDISASGRYWAYAALDEDGRSELIVQERDGAIAYAEPHFGQVAMAWSPAADALAYMAPAVDSLSFFGPLRLYDVSRDSSRLLVDQKVLAYFWSPDGRMIAYFTLPEREPPPIQARLAMRDRGRLARPEGQEELVSLALWVVEIEGGQSRQLLTFEPAPLFVSQFLPFFDQYARSHRLWSPGSDALVVPVQSANGPLVTVVPLLDDPRPLAPGVAGFWSHQ